jgi:hypothetical protein
MAVRGALLLNATLTVGAGRAGSHTGRGWERFTGRVIEIACRRHRGLVFLLWGRSAQAKGVRETAELARRFEAKLVLLSAFQDSKGQPPGRSQDVELQRASNSSARLSTIAKYMSLSPSPAGIGREPASPRSLSRRAFLDTGLWSGRSAGKHGSTGANEDRRGRPAKVLESAPLHGNEQPWLGLRLSRVGAARRQSLIDVVVCRAIAAAAKP